MEIREFWSRIGYYLPYKQLITKEIKSPGVLENSKSRIGSHNAA